MDNPDPHRFLRGRADSTKSALARSRTREAGSVTSRTPEPFTNAHTTPGVFDASQGPPLARRALTSTGRHARAGPGSKLGRSTGPARREKSSASARLRAL